MVRTGHVGLVLVGSLSHQALWNQVKSLGEWPRSTTSNRLNSMGTAAQFLFQSYISRAKALTFARLFIPYCFSDEWSSAS
jgi:hypothetical protein